MKRAIATAGLFAVSIAGLKSQNTAGLSQREASKWWNVSGSLRGFYDDNSLNSPSGAEEDSFGVEFSPGFSVNLPLERTLFRASYRLTLNYYEARIENNVDQDHQFIIDLNHKFSERRELDFDNMFVYSDAPEIAAQEGNFTRGDSTGLRNYAAVGFTHRFTPIVGLTLGYKNNFRDYQEDGDGSLSALLDQVENQFHIDGNWYPNPKTTLFAGYQFGIVNHTSEDFLADPDVFFFLTRSELSPERRDHRDHYLYVGAQRKFGPRLDVVAKVGGQYTDFYNEGTSDVSPYIEFVGNYTYLPGSSAGLSLSVQRGSTDAGVDPNGDVTLDSLVVQTAANVSHRITSRLTGSAALNYQNYTYNGGSLDGRSDDYFTFDINFEFKIRENLFANTGYVWYRLLSNRPGISFVRNRVHVGVRAVF